MHPHQAAQRATTGEHKLQVRSQTLMLQCFDQILKSGLNMEKYIPDWSFIDSFASVHMMSKVDPRAEEQDTLTISQDPNTIITASGTIRKTEQAVVHVHDLDTLVTVQLLRFPGRALAGKNYAKKRICLPIARRPSASMGPTRGKTHASPTLSYLAHKSPQMPTLHRATDGSLRLRSTECRQTNQVIDSMIVLVVATSSRTTSSTTLSLPARPSNRLGGKHMLFTLSERHQLKKIHFHEDHKSSMQKESSKSRRQNTTSNNCWRRHHSG